MKYTGKGKKGRLFSKFIFNVSFTVSFYRIMLQFEVSFIVSQFKKEQNEKSPQAEDLSYLL